MMPWWPVADVEREGDDLRGDVGREARGSLLRQISCERLPMGLLVGREVNGTGDLAQVGVKLRCGARPNRNRGARGEERSRSRCVSGPSTVDLMSALQRGQATRVKG